MSHVLWLSHETPDLNGQGGQRRQYFQVRSLLESGHHVEVLTLAGPQDDSSLRRLTGVARLRTHVRGRPLRRRVVHRLVRSRPWEGVVVAHGESLSLLDGVHPRPRVLVDLHNVYSDWYRRIDDTERSTRASILEERALGEADAVTVCSGLERSRLLAAHRTDTPVLVAPNGVDLKEWPLPVRDNPVATVVVFGKWDWLPNRRGLEWLLREVWPAVHAQLAGARLLVAGTGTEWIADAGAGVEVLGRVDDLTTLTASAAVVAVPVRDGAGSSVKFAEALSSGVPVVSTVDGANAVDGAPCVVSDEPSTWVDALCRELRSPLRSIAKGRGFAEQRLTWRATTAPIAAWLRAGDDRT